MATDPAKRINVILDAVHAARLNELAAFLDAIPGAWERTQEGTADAKAGRAAPL